MDAMPSAILFLIILSLSFSGARGLSAKIRVRQGLRNDTSHNAGEMRKSSVDGIAGPDAPRYSTGDDGTKGIWCNEIEHNGVSNKICLGMDQTDRCVTVLRVDYDAVNKIPTTQRIGSFCLFWDPSTESYGGTSRVSSIEFLTKSIYNTTRTKTNLRLVVGFTRGVYAISLEKADLLENYADGVILDDRVPWVRVSPAWPDGCLMERFHIGSAYPRLLETIRCNPDDGAIDGKPTLNIRNNIKLSLEEDVPHYQKAFNIKTGIGPKGMCMLSKTEVLVTMPKLKGFDLVHVKLLWRKDKRIVKYVKTLNFMKKVNGVTMPLNDKDRDDIGKIQDCIVLKFKTRWDSPGIVGLMSRDQNKVFMVKVNTKGKKVIFHKRDDDPEKFNPVVLPAKCGCPVLFNLEPDAESKKYFAYGCEWVPSQNKIKQPYWGGFLRMDEATASTPLALQELGKNARVTYDKACLQKCFHKECRPDKAEKDASCPEPMLFGSGTQLGQ